MHLLFVVDILKFNLLEKGFISMASSSVGSLYFPLQLAPFSVSFIETIFTKALPLPLKKLTLTKPSSLIPNSV